MKGLNISRKTSLLSMAVVFTLINSGGLGYALVERNKSTSMGLTALQEVVKPKIEVENVKKHQANPALVGKKIGTGEYKSESLEHSKIKTGSSAQLAIAEHEQTGGHFVLALLSGGHVPTNDKLSPGWSLKTIADDPMWAPGACSSKPTFLIGGKYIFIDDGKTSSSDKYDSYILFDMTTAQYKYFGGNNFTNAQGEKEKIMLTANENDKIVFYIDTADDQPYADDKSQFGHTKGKDHAYVIRREIDPQNLTYTDYSLPFTVPDSLKNYYVSAYTDLNGIAFSVVAPYATYGSNAERYYGTVKDNAITLNPALNLAVYTPTTTLDSDLELTLDGSLRTALPALAQQKSAGESRYKTLFNAYELGSYKQYRFINVSQRFGVDQNSIVELYSTPLIFDSETKQLYPLVKQAILRNFTDYVNLGVF